MDGISEKKTAGAVCMDERKKVIVAGAGAAGLMAAIAAARAGAGVTVLEAMERPGKKLLLTGNGRCNLTNLDEGLRGAYYGTGAELASSVIRQFDTSSLLDFFHDIGLLTQEKNGYVYPYSAQSYSVLEVLLAEARRLKIKLKYSEKITDIRRQKEAPGMWLVQTQGWTYEADALILACGSRAVPASGSDGSGYELAKKLGHTIRKVVPALVPVTCRAGFLSALAGVRCRAGVALWEYRDVSSTEPVLVKADTGELQWTKYGVSGIVVFQLSRFISSAQPGTKQYLEIDFLPEYEQEAVTKLLLGRCRVLGEEKAGLLLAGLLNEKLIPVVLEQADKILKSKKSLAKTVCRSLQGEQIAAMVQVMKKLRLEVTGTKDFDTAQVCAGGVDCREVSEETLESKIHKQLYFAGELLDVDGPCGGYNLQWAWSSGYVAGTHAGGDYGNQNK